MKRKSLLLFVLLAALLLTGCAFAKQNAQTAVTVLIEEGEHYSFEVGLLTVEPGESASFYIETEPDYAVTATDYRGVYSLTETRGLTKLVLEDVRYPTRIHLTLSRDYRTIRYLANGGTALTGRGTEVSERCDIRNHIRPNVSIGTDLFAREGYTLTCWNTEPDGSGERVGLGSRMTVDETATLYAQWAKWSEEDKFRFTLSDGCATITGCSSRDRILVVPESLGGCTVTTIKARAFENCPAETVILPKSLVTIEENAFLNAKLNTLSFFDNIDYITDACFTGCEDFSTLRISAIEDPFGYSFRRESVYADKLDLLILSVGEPRLIFYGGCSTWYNLIGSDAQAAFGDAYKVLNMALNGVSSSLFQMELLRAFLTERDMLIHSPEICSEQQLLLDCGMHKNDDKLWCALEYNYDLVSLVDIRVLDGGVLESLRLYLDKKQSGGSYLDVYHDSHGFEFLDETGSIPFLRTQSFDTLTDKIELLPSYLEDLSRLEAEYKRIQEIGVPVYVSYACIDVDSVPEDQQGNVELMGNLYREKISAMNGVTLISEINDFLYHDADYYDTVFHLLTDPAKRCTAVWVRDLKAAMGIDA